MWATEPELEQASPGISQVGAGWVSAEQGSAILFGQIKLLG